MRKTLLAAAVALAAAGPVSAGEIVDAATRAEDFASQGKFLEALDAVTEAQAKLWDLSPMLVRQAFFVDGEPGGFGIYNKRMSSSFQKKEILLIYAEPIGYGFGQDNGLYVVDITMDFDIKDKSGKSIANQKSFGNLTLKSQVPNREFFAKISYDFSGLQAGDYDVTTTLTDTVSGESVDFTLPFTMTD